MKWKIQGTADRDLPSRREVTQEATSKADAVKIAKVFVSQGLHWVVAWPQTERGYAKRIKFGNDH